MNIKIKNKDIIIEHLSYRILVKDIKKYPKNSWEMYVTRIDKYKCEIFLPQTITVTDIPTLAHEIVHILQYICEARNIDMIYEQENVGYLMQFIMNKLLGFEYIR